MLPKINRIKKKRDFEEIFKKGKNSKDGFFIIKTMGTSCQSRFAFVISKKVSKKAVVRNKIRRRLSRIIEVNRKNIKTGIDTVIIVLPGAEKQDFLNTQKSLQNLLKKAKLI